MIKDKMNFKDALRILEIEKDDSIKKVIKVKL
jgi:hypothetical protein